MRISSKGGAIVAVTPVPAAWRRHEDGLADRIAAMYGAASQVLNGEQNVGVLSRLLSRDLTGAIAAFTAWCVSHLTNSTADGDETTKELLAILRELRKVGSESAEHDFGLHARRLGDASVALRRLSATARSNQLVDQACAQLVDRCGFGRGCAVASRLRQLAALDGALHGCRGRRVLVRRVG